MPDTDSVEALQEGVSILQRYRLLDRESVQGVKGMPDPFHHIGKFLFVTGVVITVTGALLMLVRHNGIPFLGKLPGDIIIQRKNFTLYVPVTTSIILSVIFSLIMYVIAGRK